jgi:hypothetical protein
MLVSTPRRGPRRLLALWLLSVPACCASAQPSRNPAVQAATIDWLTARLAVREATGRNDGPAVAALVRAGGGEPNVGLEWCGFTQAADQRAHGLPIPAAGMQGAARAWFVDPRRTYYLAGRRGQLTSIAPGDLAGFDYGHGIHHITRFAQVMPPLRKGRPPRGFYTIGGNEGRGANAGVHRTYYPATNITAGARWDYR